MGSIYDELTNKYSYDSKTIKALKKVLPAIIKYYGREYESFINEALLNTKIERCSSYDTLLSMLGDYNYNQVDYQNPYYSVPTIVYNEDFNRFEISDIKKLTIVSPKTGTSNKNKNNKTSTKVIPIALILLSITPLSSTSYILFDVIIIE